MNISIYDFIEKIDFFSKEWNNKQANKNYMKAKVNFIGGGGFDNGTSNIRNVVIEVEGSKYTITYSPVYGIVINKISLKDDGTDTLFVIPRTSNEIQLK